MSVWTHVRHVRYFFYIYLWVSGLIYTHIEYYHGCVHYFIIIYLYLNMLRHTISTPRALHVQKNKNKKINSETRPTINRPFKGYFKPIKNNYAVQNFQNSRVFTHFLHTKDSRKVYSQIKYTWRKLIKLTWLKIVQDVGPFSQAVNWIELLQVQLPCWLASDCTPWWPVVVLEPSGGTTRALQVGQVCCRSNQDRRQWTWKRCPHTSFFATVISSRQIMHVASLLQFHKNNFSS